MRSIWKPVLIVLLGAQLAGCGALVVGGAAAGAAAAHDRRSVGTVIDDQGIEFNAYGRFNEHPVLKDQSHINVTSYNGAVLLSGEVPAEQAGQLAQRLVSEISNVQRVHNELVVAPPSTIGNRSADTLLTTRAKAALFQIEELPDFDATRVKVVTERGVVYLMGLLHQREADVVVERVRRVSGVQKVVTLFEYLG